jgi:hypothetical protein
MLLISVIQDIEDVVISIFAKEDIGDEFQE